MKRRNVANVHSKKGTDMAPQVSTRRLNVTISDSAYETLIAHMVRLRRPLGELVAEAISAHLTEVHIHANPKRASDPALRVESDAPLDRLESAGRVIDSQSQAA